MTFSRYAVYYFAYLNKFNILQPSSKETSYVSREEIIDLFSLYLKFIIIIN